MQVILKTIVAISILGLFIFASKPNSIADFQDQSKTLDTYVIDTATSKLHWNCHHLGAVRFNSGYIATTQENEPKEINLSIDMTSISNTDIDNKLLQGTLENVLKSDEFFNTEKYPEARFESHSITKINANNYTIEGDFIIFENGICQSFVGTIKIDGDTVYFTTKTIILNRTDWGIYYLSANNPIPKDEEEGFAVTDTLLIDAHIIAHKLQ